MTPFQKKQRTKFYNHMRYEASKITKDPKVKKAQFDIAKFDVKNPALIRFLSNDE